MAVASFFSSDMSKYRLVTPDTSGLQCHGGDETQSAVAIREGTDASDAALYLSVQTFQPVGRADADPMLFREPVVLGGGSKAFFETAKSFGHLLTQTSGKHAEPSLASARSGASRMVRM